MMKNLIRNKSRTTIYSNLFLRSNETDGIYKTNRYFEPAKLVLLLNTDLFMQAKGLESITGML